MDGFLLHFLRPYALTLLIPVFIVIGLMYQYQHKDSGWQNYISEHLLHHLMINQQRGAKKRLPLTVLGLSLILMVVALSGPAWQQKPSAFSDNDTQVVFVLKVTDSMLEKDLSPSRLKRAVFKINDLLKSQTNIKAGLVAYSGSAHLVMPLTKDPNILHTFADALMPEIMPANDGDALAEAIRLANQQLSAGSVVVLSDNVTIDAVNQVKNDDNLLKNSLLFYAVSSAELMNKPQMSLASKELKADLIPFSLDDQDIKTIARNIEKNFKQAQSDQIDYEDGGFYFIPVIVLLLLMFFRQGFWAQVWRFS